ELQNALAETPGFLTTGSSDVSIGGVTALRAITPAGALYVSADAPYRVLRFVPSNQSELAPPELPIPPPMPSLPDLPPLPGLPPLPDEPPAPPMPFGPNLLDAAPLLPDDEEEGSAPESVPESGQLDLPPMSEQDLADALEELASNIEQLTEAVDTTIQFNLQGSANVACSPGGCSVTANVTSAVTSNKKLTGGQVNATLTATVSINGRPAGSCTSAAQLPLNGSGQISCQNPGAGAVFASVEATEKARAQALSRARRGAPVPYTIAVTGIATVNAVAHTQAEVEQLVDRAKGEKEQLLCGLTPSNFTGDAEVLPLGGRAPPPIGAGDTAHTLLFDKAKPPGRGCGTPIGNDLYQHPDGSIRDAKGKIVGSTGGRVGANYERQVWDRLKAEGKKVVDEPVAVRGNDGQLRYYDGAIDLGGGRYRGIEVKPPGTPNQGYGPEQREFDAWVKQGNSAMGVGKSAGREIIDVIVIRI
ncbi:MAG: hypothetical protein ACRDPW_08785, partial [Mycobacteriales bacterium]